MADKVNLQKSYSALNEKVAKLFDDSGARRAFTVPYIDGQPMAEHIQAVGQAASKTGGLTANLLTTMHHSNGKGWGSGDGHTIGHPAHQLRNTIIPKDDENAKAAIAAAQHHLDNIGKVLGKDNQVVQTANSQLSFVKKTDGVGMNLLDFGVMLLQIMHAPNQTVAREYNGVKPDGHQPQLRGPIEASDSGEESTETDQSEAQTPQEGSEGTSAAESAPSAPAAPAVPTTEG